MSRRQAENFLIEVLTSAGAADALEHFEREDLVPPEAFQVSDEQLRLMGVHDSDTRSRILGAFSKARHEGRTAGPAAVSFAPHPTHNALAGGGAEGISVIVRDVEMQFSSMVVFMIKWAIACIPALIVLTIVGMGFSAVFGTMLASCAGALP